MKRFQESYAVVFALLLTAFSVYALLDSFVIRRVYTVVEQGEATVETETVQTEQATALGYRKGGRARHGDDGEEDASSSATVTADANEAVSSAASSETSYSAEGVQIELQTYRVNDTTVYVADVLLDDPAALLSAFAQNSYGRNVTAATSDTAAAVGAVLAINGDNYGAQQTGYVIRNGVLYRDAAAKNQEDLVIWADGSFSIVSENEVTAQELLDAGAVQVFSFGPGLLDNGEVLVSATQEVGMAMASNPRTALAMIEPGHYLLVVSDGRTSESAGLSLYELAQFLQSLGAQTAYNLDGGGSSTMVFLGQVVNHPTSGRSGGERAVTDVVYIG